MTAAIIAIALGVAGGFVAALAGVYGFAPLVLKLAAIVLLWRWRQAIEPGHTRPGPLPRSRRGKEDRLERGEGA